MTPRIAVLLAAGALSACASISGHAPSGVGDETAWQARDAQLARLDHWELQGRVAIVTQSDGGSGSMDWKQQGDTLTFDFMGPLGSGGLHIQGDADSLWVKSSRGDDFVTDDPEQDFAARLHAPLPVLSMRYWMLGEPDPHAPFDKQVDARGELVTLSQRGWQVQYQEYADVQGYTLPIRLAMQRDAVHIKVIVNQWTLDAPGSGP
jgi:outer membrane lipoprotein LolB